MSRERRALRAPGGVELDNVPTGDRSDTTLYRAVPSNRAQPWWFSNRVRSGAGAGRFDLDGSRGTCYFSTTAVGAILERVADPQAAEQPLVSTRTLESMTIWHGQVPSCEKLADVTVPSVPQLTGTGDGDTQPAVLERTPAVAYELELPPAWRAAVTRPPTAAESPQAPPP